MKNLKQFFYREYFRDIDLSKVETPNVAGLPERDAERLKKAATDQKSEITKKNEPLFKSANQILTSYTFQKLEDSNNVLDFSEQSKLATEKIVLETIYPGLFTGSGYTHETGNVGELKLGFFFDHTTGLPILPGSSVKGVLRSVFPRFEGDPTDNLNPDLRKAKLLQKNKAKFVAQLFKIPADDEAKLFEKIHQLELAIFEGVDFQKTKTARAEAKTKNQPDLGGIVCLLPMSQHDIFLEAFISRGGKNGHIIGTDAITPHGDNPLKNPIPLPFLKVLPEVEFTFQFLLKKSVLVDGSEVAVAQKVAAFEEILTTFGAGAKTNVGYGQFKNAVPEGSGDGSGSDGDGTRPEIKLADFTGKIKVGEPLTGVVVSQSKPFGKVQIKVKGEILEVEAAGSLPAPGTPVRLKINQIDAKTKIKQVGLTGLI